MLSPLKAYENNYICRTDPKDVARVESKTWMVTEDRYETETHVAPGQKPLMGHWMPEVQFGKELDARFPGCMAGMRQLSFATYLYFRVLLTGRICNVRLVRL